MFYLTIMMIILIISIWIINWKRFHF